MRRPVSLAVWLSAVSVRVGVVRGLFRVAGVGSLSLGLRCVGRFLFVAVCSVRRWFGVVLVGSLRLGAFWLRVGVGWGRSGVGFFVLVGCAVGLARAPFGSARVGSVRVCPLSVGAVRGWFGVCSGSVLFWVGGSFGVGVVLDYSQ